MADPAFSRMTLSDFLRWEDGTDTRYELIGGFVVAMAPPSRAHSALTARIASRLEAALSVRRPCMAHVEAGILHPERSDTFFVADVAVTCATFSARQQWVEAPLLIVEILSPGTERHDRRIKLPVYRAVGSIQEILLVDSDGPYAELHRREGARWIIEIFRGLDDVMSLSSVAVQIPLSELYEGLGVEEEPDA